VASDWESTVSRVRENHLHRPLIRIAFDGVSVGGRNIPATWHAIGERDVIALSRLFAGEYRG
jgi:hypothetical protein